MLQDLSDLHPLHPVPSDNFFVHIFDRLNNKCSVCTIGLYIASVNYPAIKLSKIHTTANILTNSFSVHRGVRGKEMKEGKRWGKPEIWAEIL